MCTEEPRAPRDKRQGNQQGRGQRRSVASRASVRTLSRIRCVDIHLRHSWSSCLEGCALAAVLRAENDGPVDLSVVNPGLVRHRERLVVHETKRSETEHGIRVQRNQKR